MTEFTVWPKGRVTVRKGSTRRNNKIDASFIIKQAAGDPLLKSRILSDFERVQARAIRAKVKKHVENYILNLKQALNDGMPIGNPRYQFSGVEGGIYSVSTDWPALKESYRLRKLPKYRDRFWRGGRVKRSKPLLQSYNAFYYSRGSTVKVSSKSYFDTGYGVKKFDNGARMRISTEVSVDRLGDKLLEQILRESFFGGKVLKGKGFGVDEPSKWDLTKIVWVEGRRPFVSDMAVRLGKLLQYELATLTGD